MLLITLHSDSFLWKCSFENDFFLIDWVKMLSRSSVPIIYQALLIISSYLKYTKIWINYCIVPSIGPGHIPPPEKWRTPLSWYPSQNLKIWQCPSFSECPLAKLKIWQLPFFLVFDWYSTDHSIRTIYTWLTQLKKRVKNREILSVTLCTILTNTES